MNTPMVPSASPGADGLVRRSKKQRMAGDYSVGIQVPNGEQAPSSGTATAVLLSQADRATHTRIIEGGLGLSSSRGYRTVRATRGVRSGAWYYEVEVTRLGPRGAARIGWTTAGAELQGPVGADRFGFAYRSLEGSKVHAGMREAYGAAWGEGSTIGCLIHLPLTTPALKQDAGAANIKPEEVDGINSRPFVAFFKDGEYQGVAFSDFPFAGKEFFPAVSLYTHASQVAPAQIHVNFGASPFSLPGDVDAIAEAAGLEAGVKGMSQVIVASDEPSKDLPPVVAGVEALV